MLTQLSIFGTLFFAAASGRIEDVSDPYGADPIDDPCDNQHRDSCPDHADEVGPDTPDHDESLAADSLLATTGFDDLGTFPSPKEKALIVCKDAGLKGTCKNAWTGRTNSMSSGWNDVISSSHIRSFYRCRFYADTYGGRRMGTWNGPKTINWIRSWDNIISSWACERRCTKTQEHCVTPEGACISNTYRKCKTCHVGYIRNSSGKCVKDVECTAVELTIKSVKVASESAGVPDSMDLYTAHENNCKSSTPAEVTLSATRTVSHMVDTSYTMSKSYKETLGASMSASVTLTVKGEIWPGFGADVATTVTTTGSWSQEQSSSSSQTTHQQNVTTQVWSHSSVITTAPYHNMTYTSLGKYTPGKIQWVGTMKCYNKQNTLIKTKDVEGTYSGASIASYDEERTQTACGAPSGFKLLTDVQCNDNEIHTGKYYATLYEAQNACQEYAKQCYGVMDKACDGTLDYYLCANNGAKLKTSKIGSCVYEQIQDAGVRELSARLSAAEEKLRSFA